jgi:hypothetical protein
VKSLAGKDKIGFCSVGLRSDSIDIFVLDNIFALIDEYICADQPVTLTFRFQTGAADHTSEWSTIRQFKVSLPRQTSYFANDPKNRVDNSLRMIDLSHVASVSEHLRSTGTQPVFVDPQLFEKVQSVLAGLQSTEVFEARDRVPRTDELRL